jgi:LysM repeat protein
MIFFGLPRRLSTASVIAAALVVSTLVGPAAAHESHEVEPGDSLSALALRFDTTVSALMVENGLSSPDRIRIGQKLSVPHPSSDATSPAADRPTLYTVAPGDTLGHIAIRLGVSRADLVQLNGIADPDRIRIGQRLAVPPGGVDPQAASRYRKLPDRIVSNPDRLALVPVFQRWSEANGIPVDLVMAVAWQESGWNSEALSHKGAVGVGQIMPATGVWVATDLIGRPDLDPTKAEDNIRISARYLRWLIDYHGDEELALAGYYQGPGAVRAGIMYADTELYVASVTAHRPWFTAS